MSEKNIQSDTFIPIEDALEECQTGLSKLEDKLEKDLETWILDKLNDLINRDVCLTNTQSLAIKGKATYLCQTIETGEDWVELLMPLATFINSIRNECANCLAENCEKRGNESPA